MNERDCGGVRALIPDLAAGRLVTAASDVRAHLEGCADCRAELGIAEALFAGRPSAPRGMDARIVRHLGATSVRAVAAQSPWWGLTAAAVAALALGIGIRSSDVPAGADVPGYAYEVEQGVVWASEDGLLAGAPLLDDLSDEGLEQLLDELTVGSSGGAA